MVVQPHPLPPYPNIVANDLPDDTEDSLVGIDWHQYARSVLLLLLRAVAREHERSWGVHEEIGLSGLRHRDRRPYTPRPDVLVLAAPVDGRAAEVALSVVGGPLLLVEVASESTWTNDVGDKREAYAAAGVGEYLVFDPSGDYLAERVRAWRLDGEGRYEEWWGEEGLWWSRALEVGFFMEGPLLRVRDAQGWTPSPEAVWGELQAQRRAEAEAARADAEAARAEAEAARADVAEEQVRQEARARVQAEAELRRLRALLDEAQRRLDDPRPS